MSDKVRVNGLTAENATLLLAAAEELSQPANVVQTQSDGYFLAPKDVAKKAGVKFEEDELQTESEVLPEREVQDDHGTEGPDTSGSENVKAAVDGQSKQRAQSTGRKAGTAKKAASSKAAAEKE